MLTDFLSPHNYAPPDEAQEYRRRFRDHHCGDEPVECPDCGEWLEFCTCKKEEHGNPD